MCAGRGGARWGGRGGATPPPALEQPPAACHLHLPSLRELGSTPAGFLPLSQEGPPICDLSSLSRLQLTQGRKVVCSAEGRCHHSPLAPVHSAILLVPVQKLRLGAGP